MAPDALIPHLASLCNTCQARIAKCGVPTAPHLVDRFDAEQGVGRTTDSLTPAHRAHRFRLSTDQFAAQQLVESQTVRKLYNATGSYHGVKPIRLPNRRLLWPDDTVEQLLS